MSCGRGAGAELDGGAGRDTIVGSLARDIVSARDGEPDAIDCGLGVDMLTADLRDVPIPDSCEFVNLAPLREGPNVAIRSRSLRIGRDGSTRVRMTCPRRLPRACRGTLALRLDRPGAAFGPRTRNPSGGGAPRRSGPSSASPSAPGRAGAGPM